MGLPFSTMNPASLLSASFKVLIIYIIILPPSPVGQSGAFDAPKIKCPPDGGSSSCVTGSPTFIPSASLSSVTDPISNSPLQTSKSDGFSFQSQFPRLTSGSNVTPTGSEFNTSTPLLTPDTCSPEQTTVSFTSGTNRKDALDFLMTLFPRQGLLALPHSKGLSISAPNLSVAFDAVLLDLPGTSRTLYVDSKSAETVNLRERYGGSMMSGFGLNLCLSASLHYLILHMNDWDVWGLS
ncbi:hypothetical protein AX17_003084 [Amanita inopinata Kibby_2008]|nr:hypothetical protein AX17_003084 [Amanita inopinata Kibby_2008]